MKFEVLPRAVICSSDGKILLLRRHKDDENRPGDWDFPGGGVEPGEDYKAACRREIQEETGILVRPSDLELFYAGSTFDETKKQNKVRLIFLVKVDHPRVKLSFEHEEFKWIEPKEAIRIFTHPFYNAALKYAVSHRLLG